MPSHFCKFVLRGGFFVVVCGFCGVCLVFLLVFFVVVDQEQYLRFRYFIYN